MERVGAANPIRNHDCSRIHLRLLVMLAPSRALSQFGPVVLALLSWLPSQPPKPAVVPVLSECDCRCNCTSVCQAEYASSWGIQVSAALSATASIASALLACLSCIRRKDAGAAGEVRAGGSCIGVL